MIIIERDLHDYYRERPALPAGSAARGGGHSIITSIVIERDLHLYREKDLYNYRQTPALLQRGTCITTEGYVLLQRETPRAIAPVFGAWSLGFRV